MESNFSIMNHLIPTFKKYQVTDVSTLQEFIKKYMLPQYYEGKYNQVVASRQRTIDNSGYTIIPHSMSTTGNIVTYFQQ